MSHHDNNDGQTQISQQELLRFLDTGPQLVRRGYNANSGCESSASPASTCPQTESYFGLITGTITGAEADELLTHAATCPECGDVLARSMNVLEGNPSPEETAAIAELAAAREEWQRGVARMMAATPARKPASFWHSHRFKSVIAGSGVAAALLLAGGLFLWQRQKNTPEYELATAYQESRTLELRIPEAGYAGLVAGGHTRGTLTDREPAKLLDARAKLARELEKSPQDAHWLELQARADVLEERYDPAVEVLDRLVAQGPVTAELLADAASAYYQRGLVSGNELDRSTALDYLRRADELAPADPVILFNEAIVMEDRGQMMNAVEVWNRYITVERDAKWAAEGKRKLAALMETLNRIKSHASRMKQMLATPQAMDALAADAPKLAALDEELSSYRLGELLQTAYPAADHSPLGTIAHPARGSPCLDSCLAARKLLQAIGASLELQHHDPWLSDLIIPTPDSLPAATSDTYLLAMQKLAQSTSAKAMETPAASEKTALEARQLFLQLGSSAQADARVGAAAQSGVERAAAEYIKFLQFQTKFADCRAFANTLRSGPTPDMKVSKYPWIDAVEMTTEKVCDDTPETRPLGHRLALAALHLAEVHRYPLLTARNSMRQVGDAQNSGDYETAERITTTVLRQLYAMDPPIDRIFYTLSGFIYTEGVSPRLRTAALYQREQLRWYEYAGQQRLAVVGRLGLAGAEARIGARKEAQDLLNEAYKNIHDAGWGPAETGFLVEPEILLANTLLEQGDLSGADRALTSATAHMNNYSDTWGLRTYRTARGQLLLARGDLKEAASTLESEIHENEGRNVRGGDRTTAAEYAELDHDLYAELAATWLAQGRPAESIWALWERFRMRSRGLPIAQCSRNVLDCDLPTLLTAQNQLGDDVLTGQIVLLDRVLVYRAGKKGVTWSQRSLPRQDVLEAAQLLERAVSSPLSSQETVARLGTNLSAALLPDLPTSAGMEPDAAVLLEPDPLLQNLPWPVLPAGSEALGLRYPLAEMRSILAKNSVDSNRSSINTDSTKALIVGSSMAAGGEPPLPEALREARSVDRILHAPDLLLGEQATAANVAELLGSATIFHFAGHAVKSGNGAELLLAASSPGDSAPWMDGRFLRQHPPRACRLAVLSACATGSHESSWNHPLQDMVETLGSLGVPEVVATRWQIDSESAVPFMNAFYQDFSKRNNVAVALTSARRVLSSQSLYRNPYYWAAYYGTGREMTRVEGDLHASR